jgi:hypothetical protein
VRETFPILYRRSTIMKTRTNVKSGCIEIVMSNIAESNIADETPGGSRNNIVFNGMGRIFQNSGDIVLVRG